VSCHLSFSPLFTAESHRLAIGASDGGAGRGNLRFMQVSRGSGTAGSRPSSLRGLEVLEVIAGMRQPASLAAVARRCALSESQAFRVLRGLELSGYVDHVRRGGYRIGSRAIALATVIGPRPELLRIVHPVLARLAAHTRESAVLHLRSGNRRVLVLGVPGPHPDRRELIPIGERSVLSRGCSGRVILAYLPEEATATRGRARVSGSRLAAIRARGYDVSLGENHPDINGVAAPLLDEDETAFGSITVAGQADRLAPPALERHSAALVRACRELSPQLMHLLGPHADANIAALDLEAHRSGTD
jgi:DNA-binding IclR family transcriptional regulator